MFFLVVTYVRRCALITEERMIKKCMPSTDVILGMSNEDFIKAYEKTALSRPGLEKIKSNIMAVI